MLIKIKKFNSQAIIPEYKTHGSAGFDLHALDEIAVYPGKTYLVRTGVGFEIPAGYELQIRPRSGMSLNTPIRLANTPGTIDSDYRGEVGIIVQNVSNSPIDAYTIKKGERIAQGVLNKIEIVDFIEVEELPATGRGENGFGSTDNN